MAFRNLTRSFWQVAKQTNINQRLYSSIQRKSIPTTVLTQRYVPIRSFSVTKTNDNAYRELETFLQKEIQLEKSAQKHPSKLPAIPNFQVHLLLVYFVYLNLPFLFVLGSNQWSRSHIDT